jgi:hypothetical protein
LRVIEQWVNFQSLADFLQRIPLAISVAICLFRDADALSIVLPSRAQILGHKIPIASPTTVLEHCFEQASHGVIAKLADKHRF